MPSVHRTRPLAPRLVLTVLATASLAVGGCTASAAKTLHSVNAAGLPVSVKYLGPITKPVTVFDHEISEKVPSAADIKAAITPETALSKCTDRGIDCFRDPKTVATETLARVTSNYIDPTELQNRLVYMFRQDGLECVPMGPAQVPKGVTCTSITFIDALTDEGLGTVEGG
jgi:hypothetical protein